MKSNARGGGARGESSKQRYLIYLFVQLNCIALWLFCQFKVPLQLILVIVLGIIPFVWGLIHCLTVCRQGWHQKLGLNKQKNRKNRNKGISLLIAGLTETCAPLWQLLDFLHFVMDFIQVSQLSK